ncbi:MAG: glycosyltransferase [Fibrobacter sp.]|nr:glycosyltransferase [Fibrobacter sp.]
MIKVSVIVPVYTVPLEYLRECFDSLKDQTMRECEFIIISDGAPDAECAICDEYAKNDPRFKFFRKEHAGVSATRNYGIEQAQGKYITFVDADDKIVSTNCEIAYNFAQEHSSDIVIWEAERFGCTKRKSKFYKNELIDTIEYEETLNICKNTVFTFSERYSIFSLVCCKLFKKKLLQENNLKYPTDLSFNEDRLFNISAFKAAKKISYLNKPFYFYRIHNQSTSHKFVNNAFYEFTKFLKMFDSNDAKLYKSSVSHEYVRSFFLSWASYYLHPANKTNLKQNILQLKAIILSKDFQTHIKGVSICNFSFLLGIEIVFFRRRCTLPLYLHYIKFLILTRVKK